MCGNMLLYTRLYIQHSSSLAVGNLAEWNHEIKIIMMFLQNVTATSKFSFQKLYPNHNREQTETIL